MRLRLGVTCLSIAANALCAGGIFVFPILSPALASLLKLTQPQLTTIILAGMIGQYPFAPVVGKVIDLYGPSASSLIAAALFFVAFMSTSLEISMAPIDISQSSTSSFYHLTFFFLLAGLGTVFSYFSSLFSASKNFSAYPGLAAGVSMALFGLSPLCLSFLALNFFSDTTSGLLDIVRFLKFLAILTAAIHILGAFALRPAGHSITVYPNIDTTAVDSVDESSRLLPQSTLPTGTPKVTHPLRDKYFWLLALYCLLLIGATEMVISNIGSIVLSLPLPSSTIISEGVVSNSIISRQVKIPSISNTVSRIIVGPLADFVSPVAASLPSGAILYPRKHRVSRVIFLSGTAFLLAASFLWIEIGAKDQEAVWVLSVGTGISYGVIFTVLPSIISAIWGPRDLGRNFGMITYAPFIGTPIFSYLYAFISAANSRGKNICEGKRCWEVTFWISCGSSTLALFGSIMLWRQWKGRV